MKHIKGRKRFLAVDVQGNLIEQRVVAVNTGEGAGAQKLIAQVWRIYPSITQIFVDEGFKARWIAEVERRYGVSVLVILKDQVRGAWGLSGTEPPVYVPFRVFPIRWIVERTFAWIGKYRRHAKDYELLTSESKTWIDIAMICTLLRGNYA